MPRIVRFGCLHGAKSYKGNWGTQSFRGIGHQCYHFIIKRLFSPCNDIFCNWGPLFVVGYAYMAAGLSLQSANKHLGVCACSICNRVYFAGNGKLPGNKSGAYQPGEEFKGKRLKQLTGFSLSGLKNGAGNDQIQ